MSKERIDLSINDVIAKDFLYMVVVYWILLLASRCVFDAFV